MIYGHKSVLGTLKIVLLFLRNTPWAAMNRACKSGRQTLSKHGETIPLALWYMIFISILHVPKKLLSFIWFCLSVFEFMGSFDCLFNIFTHEHSTIKLPSVSKIYTKHGGVFLPRELLFSMKCGIKIIWVFQSQITQKEKKKRNKGKIKESTFCRIESQI